MNLIVLIFETWGALALGGNTRLRKCSLYVLIGVDIQSRFDKGRDMAPRGSRAVPCCGTGTAIFVRCGRIRPPPTAATFVRPSFLGRRDCARSCLRVSGGSGLVASAHIQRAPGPAAETAVCKARAPLLTSSDAALADALGSDAARLSPDLGAYQIGSAYTNMLPREYRAQHGIYYTPPSLADRLIHQATAAGVDWGSARILDPASGGGAFLAPVACRIIRELPGCSPRILVENIATRLRGFEIDPLGAWLSQVTLDAILLPITLEARKQLPVVVSVCNSLHKNAGAEFDPVIGNPPYGRTRFDLPTRKLYQRSLYGHANLYGVFTDLALRHAAHGGIIAYVTPTSFLAGEYFKNLRALLAREAPPVTIDFVSVRADVFENVLQETLLATYRRGADAADIQVSELSPSGPERLDVDTIGMTALPPDPSQPWLLARRSVEALGKDADSAVGLGIRGQHGTARLESSQGSAGCAAGRKTLPAHLGRGGHLRRPFRVARRAYFEVRKGDDWLITNCPCVLVQRTTAKEQNRRLIAAALPPQFVFRHSAVMIENHLNMIKPIIKPPPVSADVLAAFLNSAAADRAFRCVSGSVAV